MGIKKYWILTKYLVSVALSRLNSSNLIAKDIYVDVSIINKSIRKIIKNLKGRENESVLLIKCLYIISVVYHVKNIFNKYFYSIIEDLFFKHLIIKTKGVLIIISK